MTTLRRTALLALMFGMLSVAPAAAGSVDGTTASGGLSAAIPLPPNLGQSATFDYFYAAAATQQLNGDYAKGASATFVVEHPKQVRTGHSLAELAVESPAMDYSYIEAGWIVTPHEKPQLFVFWWDQQVPKCYNQGCGWVQDGDGIQPGATLRAHSTLKLAWRQQHGDWVLYVDGERSGYYPDSQWTGSFSKTGFAQVFGEVAIKDPKPVCADMGDGKPGDDPDAATISDVSFVHGPPVDLRYDLDDPGHNYTLDLRSGTSIGYGGPGVC
jgi:hypothetical protein